MRFWVEYMGPVWCGAVEDAEQALEHSTQAVRYVLQGKNDCLRSAAQVSAGDPTESPAVCVDPQAVMAWVLLASAGILRKGTLMSCGVLGCKLGFRVACVSYNHAVTAPLL